jgi:hypothetical protein
LKAGLGQKGREARLGDVRLADRALADVGVPV